MFRSVLVVTDDLADLARWMDWLERAGFAVAACPGPTVRARCPRLHGQPCLLREVVQVAVVAASPEAATGRPGKRPERRCTKVPDDATTIFIDQFGMEATVGGRVQRLGQPTESSLVAAATYLCARQTHPAGKQTAKAWLPARAIPTASPDDG